MADEGGIFKPKDTDVFNKPHGKRNNKYFKTEPKSVAQGYSPIPVMWRYNRWKPIKSDSYNVTHSYRVMMYMNQLLL